LLLAQGANRYGEIAPLFAARAVEILAQGTATLDEARALREAGVR
jgi:hypothetical protein